MNTKHIEIIMPNFKILYETLNMDDGALEVYKRIQNFHPGFNETNIKLKKDLSDDEIKNGEKLYDFGNIKNGERIITSFIEPVYEYLTDVIPLTRLTGLNLYGPEYIHGCRYHFQIKNPIYQTTESLSILYDIDFKKFALEPNFHKGNYSVLTDLKPFMSSHRPIFDGNKYSMRYNPSWHNTLKELLESLSNEEGFYSISNQSIDNIVNLYEKHKLYINL